MDRPLSFFASASEDVVVDWQVRVRVQVQVQVWLLWAREVLVSTAERRVSDNLLEFDEDLHYYPPILCHHCHS